MKTLFDRLSLESLERLDALSAPDKVEIIDILQRYTHWSAVTFQEFIQVSYNLNSQNPNALGFIQLFSKDYD